MVFLSSSDFTCGSFIYFEGTKKTLATRQNDFIELESKNNTENQCKSAQKYFYDILQFLYIFVCKLCT